MSEKKPEAAPKQGCGSAVAKAPNRTSSNNPTQPRMVVARERQRRALELRMEHKTYEVIGAELGVSGEAARKAVNRALEAMSEENAELSVELRAMEAARIERASAIIWPRVEAGDLRALDRWIRLRESYRRLLNLDLDPRASESGGLNVHINTAPPWERPDVIDGEVVGLPETTGDPA